MTTATGQGLSPAQRRRRLSLALLRAAVSTAALVSLYYLLPLDLVFDVPLWLPLVVGLLILVTVATFQLKRVAQSRHPEDEGRSPTRGSPQDPPPCEGCCGSPSALPRPPHGSCATRSRSPVRRG
jgi:hypothetical protein